MFDVLDSLIVHVLLHQFTNTFFLFASLILRMRGVTSLVPFLHSLNIKDDTLHFLMWLVGSGGGYKTQYMWCYTRHASNF